MTSPTMILSVRFKTPLSLEDVLKVADERIDDFRALSGLKQKYYVQNAETGEIGGIYVWETEDDFHKYRESELRATIASAYQTQGEPRVEILSILRVLRD